MDRRSRSRRSSARRPSPAPQQRLADNKRFAARNTKIPSLLQGLTACAGLRLRLLPHHAPGPPNKKIFYYRCLGSDDYRYPGGRVCSNTAGPRRPPRYRRVGPHHRADRRPRADRRRALLLLANIALSVLDEHFTGAWQTNSGSTYQRTKRRRLGLANYRIVRYADDFVVLVAGTQAHAQDLREEVATVLAPIGLRLSEAKTKVCHIDEGFDFLGFRIQRRRKRGTTKRVVYTYPSKKALASIVGRVRALTRRSSHPTLAALLRQLNPVLRGWCTYFRHGVSKATFGYLDQYTWHRVVRWIRKRHHKAKWAVLLRRYLPHGVPPRAGSCCSNRRR